MYSLDRQSVLITSKAPWLQQCRNRKIRWINNQSQGVKTRPEEEDFWQAEARASAKDGTVPATCGWAKGCQVWDKYFFKDSFSPCKTIFDPSFFHTVSPFLEHPSHKLMFQKEKRVGGGEGEPSFEQKLEAEESIFSKPTTEKISCLNLSAKTEKPHHFWNVNPSTWQNF